MAGAAGALYVQDDIRVRKDLTVSAGVRQEYQQHIGGVNIAPRGGIAWSPFRNGKTTIRAGGGVFFDWFDAQAYEQGVQLDGTHQQIETIVQPGYPNPSAGGQALLLPAGRVQFASNLVQPTLTEAIAAVEQTLPGDVRVNTMFIRRRGTNQLRGVNVNAPLANGLRPDPLVGHDHRDRVDRGLGVRRRQRQPQLLAAAAADLRRGELHARPIASTTPTARSACRPTPTISPPSAGRRWASRGIGS